MMSLIDWREELPAHWQVYALIDPLADNKPLVHWYQYADNTDAWPLYAGTEFSGDVLSGPWLLPLNACPSWLDWWQIQELEHKATGVLIASEYPPEQQVKHWRSLLTAGLDGEEVLFRYYDPRVLGPMLYTFTEDETRRFLGPTNEILVWHHNDWVVASPYPEPDVTEHHESWWRMQEPHFVGQPGSKAVTLFNIEQWLWRNANEPTTQLYEQQGPISESLDQAYQRAISANIPELWCPAWMILNIMGYEHWWPHIQNLKENGDEQKALMAKVIDKIKIAQVNGTA
jgi:hypothetical protein